MAITDTIETLQKDVTQITTELAETKKLEDEALKKTKAEAAELKAEALLGQVTTAKEEANKKLEALKGKTDATSLAEISKLENEIADLEAMLVTLNASKTELATLKEGIAPVISIYENEEKDKEEEKKDKKKSKYDDKKGRLKRQIDGFSDKTEENHGLKNTGRILGGLGIVALGARGIKKLFGLGKKKEAPATGNTPGAAPAQKETKRGKKILIGLGVGTGGYYLVHGLVTGKRDIKDFFDWNKDDADNHDKSEDQVESYEDFIENHEEDAEKYEAFGGNVDELYDNIFSKELESGWQDDGGMATVGDNAGSKNSLKGLVPFCMDNSFSSVDSMLSEWGVGIDLMEKSTQEIQGKIGDFLTDPVGGSLHLFLQALPSWMQFAKGKNTKEQAEEWLSHDTADRIAELRLFFREQMRVTTFLKTKEGELLKVIAAKKYATDPAGFDDVSEAIDDDDRFEKNIENDPDYKLFRSGKILGAYSILETYGVMNGDIDEDTKTIVEEYDEDRDDILFQNDGGSILDRCQTDIQEGSLNTKNKDQLAKSCDKIYDDIEELEDVAADSAMDMYGRLFNTENANKDELLNNSTILPLLREIRKSVPEMKAKIQSGKMTVEDMIALKLFMNNYFALKKELKIGTEVYQLIKSEDGSVVLTYGQLFRDSCHNIVKGWEKFCKGEIPSAFARGIPGLVGFGVTIAPIAILAGGVIAFKTSFGTGLRYTAKVVGAPITLGAKVYQAGLRSAKQINGKFTGPAGSIRRRFFDGIDGPKKLLKSLENGKISLAKASEIVNGTEKCVLPDTKKIWMDLRSPNGVELNRKLLKQAFTSKTMTDPERDMLAKHIDNRSFNRIVVTNMTEGIRLINIYEAKLLSLTSNQKKLFDALSDYKKLSSADMEVLIKNIDKVNVEGIAEGDFKKIIKGIGKDMSVIYDVDKFNAKINSLKVSTTSDVFDIIDPKIAKEKVAFDIYETRKTNLDNLTKEFDAGGKYEKYGPKYKSLYEDPHANLQALDKQLADEMVDAKDPLVNDVLNKIKTRELTIFENKLQGQIDILEADKKMFLSNSSADKIARKSIQRQIDDLKVVKDMSSTMNKQELDAFQSLMEIFKTKSHVMGEITEVWKKARGNVDLMKALSDGDAVELKRLKATGIAEITDDVIKVFEDIKIKKIAKILAASNIEDIIKPLLKAFARLT